MSAKAKKEKREGSVRNTNLSFFEEVRRVLNLPRTANATDVFIEIGRLKGKAGDTTLTTTTSIPYLTVTGGDTGNVW